MSKIGPASADWTRRCRSRTIFVLFALLTVAALIVFYGWSRPSKAPPEIRALRVFPYLKIPLPVVFTHAGDGTNRIFVGSQLGVIHVFPNDQSVKNTSVFLDIQHKVVCLGEEGFLGLAFHPLYKTNGEFFVYYTTDDHQSVISRFRVAGSDPNQADIDSEDEILRIQQPYSSHNGGTLAFGPDGFLYIGLGDGGNVEAAKPNAQDLSTLLGSILRIDVDRKGPGTNYAVPKDNPFVGQPDARPEIWAYGLRNVWRLAFDRQTGALWAGDVGQERFEEINIVVRGGNYGWHYREGKHPYVANGSPPPADLIEPIWEYDRDTGHCIIGGYVYRGDKIPALRGTYLFADYIANKAWTLRYDIKTHQVTHVGSIQHVNNMPIVTFGEDEAGEVYFTDGFGKLYGLAEVPE